MNRSFYIMAATLLVFATVWQTGCSKRSAPESALPTASDKQSPPGDEVTKTALPTAKAEQPINEQSPESSQLSESDLARTSWENPFRPRLWLSDGWQINEDSMVCESDIGKPATFLRPYRNVVIECRFSHSDKQETEPATEEDSPIECEIRLLNKDSYRWASLSLSSTDVTLTESIDGANSTIRESARSTGEDSSEVTVRLTLTPNRLLVSVDGQMKINVTRPGPIMMSDCLAQFIVSRDVALSDLRFEGD